MRCVGAGRSLEDLRSSWCSQMYPVLISSVGSVIGLITLFLQKRFYKVNEMEDVENALKGILATSTVLMNPGCDLPFQGVFAEELLDGPRLRERHVSSLFDVYHAWRVVWPVDWISGGVLHVAKLHSQCARLRNHRSKQQRQASYMALPWATSPALSQ